MSETLKTYRIRTEVGNTHDTVIHVPLNQTYDMLEILSLKLDQKNAYRSYTSDYGVIVGRVQANDAVGIPNCKVSVFIPYDEDNTDVKKSILYHFSTAQATDNDGVRYNLLPDELDEACHQNVGTFPNKRLVLDNKDELEIFEEYWKYTTVTNESGDYMLYGIPTGSQQIHIDVDLSDIGIWSQRPTDMVFKGYNINQFESPNMFKQSKNLNSLSQIYTQDKGLYVYPYWGETTENGDTIGITRCDINIDYKFEPTCIFMGSIITDSGNNAIGKNCAGDKRLGKMENLTTGEGSIEMIRKTFDNKVEQIRIKGDRVIDGDGVWCYQIPMNLDYVKTDEFGNLVPSDDPTKGIPTRARVRFRISLDDQPNDGQARKRCKYLVPNNPHIEDTEFAETKEPDYEFGSATREESYCDLFWNKVYSVKNYIPRFQKKNKVTIREHSGIKLINHYADGTNPMPYNNLTIKLSFQYRLICVIVKIFIYIIEFINFLLRVIILPFCTLCKVFRKINSLPWPLNKIIGVIVSPIRILACGISDAVRCIKISENFCDDGVNPNVYYPGCKGCIWETTESECKKGQSKNSKEDKLICTNETNQLFNCVENDLAQDNEATSFNFENDWVNGVLYAPLWYRKITKKKKFFFGLFSRKAKDEWCTANESHSSMRLFKSCATERKSDPDKNNNYKNFDGKEVTYYRVQGNSCYDDEECQNTTTQVWMNKGVIKQTTNLLGKYIYYYVPAEYIIDNDLIKEDSKGHVNRLFATDIILLGSLNDCDIHGIPQFFKSLDPTTYNLPSDILFTDHEFLDSFDENGNFIDTTYTEFSEAAGCDWGNSNEYGKDDGGLFYNIGCATINLYPKSCVNLSRICELGVSLDESKNVPNLNNLAGDENAYDYLRTDGFVSYDELSNFDARSEFATLNGNKLQTKVNTSNGLKEYDFRYLYPENFDGSLLEIMQRTTQGYSSDVNYKENYKLETVSKDYYKFRMGNNPYYYDNRHSFPRYENSFYFYFGLKDGKTAIEKFNSQFFAECESLDSEETAIGIKTVANSWCGEQNNKYDGYVALDLNNISAPYDLEIDSQTNGSFNTISLDGLTDEKLIIGGNNIDTEAEAYKNLINDGYIFTHNDIPNGEYQITITDSGGEITTAYFSLKASTIRFSTSSMDFKKDNNTLLQEFKSYINVAKDTTDAKFVTDETGKETTDVSRKIGGVIGIYNVINGNDYATKDFRITVEPQDKDKVLPTGFVPVSFIVNGSGSVTPSGDGALYNKKNDDNGWRFIIGVPYGGISYKITITGLCDGKDSNNTSTSTVIVNEPIQYKLFINDVDVSVIQKDFKTGWTISGNLDNFNISNNGTFNGWLNISDANNINDYGNGQNLFDWNQNKKYKKETYGYDKNQAVDSETNKTALAQVKEARQSFIALMKSAFYLTCAEESKNIRFTVQTSAFPYDIASVYRNETTKQGTYSSYNVLVCGNSETKYSHVSTSSISDVEIPTITYVNDLTYGGGKGINETAAYAKDSRSDCSDEMKEPYFVACVNSDGNTIPSENVGKEEQSGKYNLTGNVSGYFGFHIIDKRFKGDYIVWSYINNIPYYKPNNTDNIGQSIKMAGLLAGYLYNGIPNNVPTSESRITEFNAQTFGNNNLTVESVDLNEDAIPTRRIIYDDKKLPYENYIVDKVIENNYQYAQVTNRTLTLDIEDTSCTINKDIEGNLRISLLSSSINDMKNGNYYLNVGNNLSMDETEITYYIFSADKHQYPLNSILYNKKDGKEYYTADMKGVMTAWEDTNPLTMFNYATTLDVIKKRIANNIDSYSNKTNDNGDTEKVYHVNGNGGYGTSGYFSNVKDGAFYVIGVTEGNVRVISPVYAYPKLTGTITFGKYTSKVEDGTEEQKDDTTDTTKTATNETTSDTNDDSKKETIKYKNVEDYKVSFGINNISEDTFYFKYYPYTLSALIQFSDTNKIEASGNVDGGVGGMIYADLTEKNFQLLTSYYYLPFSNIINKKTTLTAVDYTGLTHVFGISKFSKEDKYIVTWKLNYDKASWTGAEDDIEDVEKAYLTTETYKLNDCFKGGKEPDASDDAELLGWSTDKNTTWEDPYSETYHKTTDTISAKTAEIWYGVWHKVINVIFHVSENGGMWKDSTTDDVKLMCDSKNQCKMDDETKMNPKNTDTNLMFEKWTCDDDTVTIADDGTITTDHTCTVYPIWAKVKVVADTNHTYIGGDGDSDTDLTKLYYYIATGDEGTCVAEGVTFEEVELADGELKIQFTEKQTTTEDGKNVKIIKVSENDVNKDRYYRFRAKYNGNYSDTIEIRQVGKEQIILPAFDYLTFKYNWTDDDGRDLDSATTIRNSHIKVTDSTTLDDYYVGYGGNGNSNAIVKTYIQHGGDNMSSGDEGALVNWKTILNRDYISEGITTLYCDIYANWFGTRNNGNMSVTFNTYKGDTGMEKDGYTFKPKDGTVLVSTKTLNVINVNAHGADNALKDTTIMKTLYSKVATLEYDIKSKTALLYGVYEQTGRNLDNFSVTIDGQVLTTNLNAKFTVSKKDVASTASSGSYSISKMSFTQNNVNIEFINNEDVLKCYLRYYKYDEEGHIVSDKDGDWCTVNYTYNSDGTINVSYSITQNTYGVQRECDIVFGTTDNTKTNYLDIQYCYNIYQLA